MAGVPPTLAPATGSVTLTDVQFLQLLQQIGSNNTQSEKTKAQPPSEFTGIGSVPNHRAWLESAHHYLDATSDGTISQKDLKTLLSYFTKEASSWACSVENRINAYENNVKASIANPTDWSGHRRILRPSTPTGTTSATWAKMDNFDDAPCSWSDFENMFHKTYVSTDRTQDAREKLTHLQAEGSLAKIAMFNIQFELLSADTKFDENSLVYIYKSKLPLNVKTPIVLNSPPSNNNLKGLMKRAQTVDQDLTNLWVKRGQLFAPTPHGDNQSGKSRSQTQPQVASTSCSTTITSTVGITCYNCGKPGHKFNVCPDKKKEKQTQPGRSNVQVRAQATTADGMTCKQLEEAIQALKVKRDVMDLMNQQGGSSSKNRRRRRK
jgi:hypothetical protein